MEEGENHPFGCAPAVAKAMPGHGARMERKEISITTEDTETTERSIVTIPKGRRQMPRHMGEWVTSAAGQQGSRGIMRRTRRRRAPHHGDHGVHGEDVW